MDNLIAEHKCREMIVVMSCDYAFIEGEEAVFFPGDFDRELMEDLIPYVETHFPVKRGRNYRATGRSFTGVCTGGKKCMQAPG